MKPHYRARRLALQGLCCLDAQGTKVIDLVEDFIEDSDEKLEVLLAARAMLRQTWETLAEHDAILARHAHNWDLNRLAMVDRNILRLAVEEMASRRTPPQVVIAEAIKLAREFSSAESPRFINGILDAVARELAGKNGREKPASE